MHLRRAIHHCRLAELFGNALKTLLVDHHCHRGQKLWQDRTGPSVQQLELSHQYAVVHDQRRDWHHETSQDQPPQHPAVRQTIYYPYYFASIFGRGTALNLAVSSPSYTAEVAENVPYLDVSGVHDAEAGILTFFAVNRRPTEALDMGVSLQGFGGAAQVIDHQVMTHPNVSAVNTSANPMAVVPQKASGASIGGDTLNAKLPLLSYQMLRVKLS